MGNDNYIDTISNIGNVLGQFSQSMSKAIEGINIIASSEALKKFTEFMQSIPDDVTQSSIKENEGMSTESLGKVLEKVLRYAFGV